MTELILRRIWAEAPDFFDFRRAQWRQAQRKRCPQQARDLGGRFARAD